MDAVKRDIPCLYEVRRIRVCGFVYMMKEDDGGVARNNLVFSALSIFRVEGSVTLKMLNLLIVNQ